MKLLVFALNLFHFGYVRILWISGDHNYTNTIRANNMILFSKFQTFIILGETKLDSSIYYECTALG